MNTDLELEDKNGMTHDQRMKNGVGCKFCQLTMMEFVFTLGSYWKTQYFIFVKLTQLSIFPSSV
jgi:hypothetical protein